MKEFLRQLHKHESYATLYNFVSFCYNITSLYDINKIFGLKYFKLIN